MTRKCQRSRPSMRDMEPTPTPPLLSERTMNRGRYRRFGPPIVNSSAVVFHFPAGTKLEHALELMSNGSCGD